MNNIEQYDFANELTVEKLKCRNYNCENIKYFPSGGYFFIENLFLFPVNERFKLEKSFVINLKVSNCSREQSHTEYLFLITIMYLLER